MERQKERERYHSRSATLQVPRALASWAESGSPSSKCWGHPDYLEVVECKLCGVEEDEFLEAAVVRSEYCAASLRIDSNHQCAVKKGDWCNYCDAAAKDQSLLLRIVKLVKKLDHLAIAEEKMIGAPGGMQKCIGKAQGHEYYDDGKKNPPLWLKPCLVTSDYWDHLAKSTIQEDKTVLNALACTNQKNQAFVRICEYNVALLTPSPQDS